MNRRKHRYHIKRPSTANFQDTAQQDSLANDNHQQTDPGPTSSNGPNHVQDSTSNSGPVASALNSASESSAIFTGWQQPIGSSFLPRSIADFDSLLPPGLGDPLRSGLRGSPPLGFTGVRPPSGLGDSLPLGFVGSSPLEFGSSSMSACGSFPSSSLEGPLSGLSLTTSGLSPQWHPSISGVSPTFFPPLPIHSPYHQSSSSQRLNPQAPEFIPMQISSAQRPPQAVFPTAAEALFEADLRQRTAKKLQKFRKDRGVAKLGSR